MRGPRSSDEVALGGCVTRAVTWGVAQAVNQEGGAAARPQRVVAAEAVAHPANASAASCRVSWGEGFGSNCGDDMDSVMALAVVSAVICEGRAVGECLVLLRRFVASEGGESFAVVGGSGALVAELPEGGPGQYVFGRVLSGEDQGGE
jgi:hypothetical protein